MTLRCVPHHDVIGRTQPALSASLFPRVSGIVQHDVYISLRAMYRARLYLSLPSTQQILVPCRDSYNGSRCQ